MIQSGIFSRNQAAPSPKLVSTTDEFDISSVMMENFINMEENFIEMNESLIIASHIAEVDGDVDILYEGIGDYLRSAATFFKNLLIKFTDLMKRVFMWLRAYLGNFDKFINSYRDKLSKLDPKFSIKGHKFSFETQVPNLGRITSVINDYNNEIRGLENTTMEDIAKERSEFTSDEWMDKVRGEVIGAHTSVPKERFYETVRGKYRSGETEEIDIDVDGSVLKAVLNEYSNIKKTYNECSSQRDKTILLISSIQSFFNKGSSINYDNGSKVVDMHSIKQHSSGSSINRDEKVTKKYSELDKINAFYSFKVVQAKELGGIAITAITEKVNALKQNLRQCETIVRRSAFSKAETSEKN